MIRATRANIAPTPWLVALVLTAAVAAMPASAEDDPRAKPLFNASVGTLDLLKTFQSNEKAVTVVLRGGARYSGRVKAVGTSAVILTGLRGKEFFDAWIPLESIVAMEERVRLR